MAGACVYEVHSLRGHVLQMLWVLAVTAGFGRRRRKPQKQFMIS